MILTRLRYQNKGPPDLKLQLVNDNSDTIKIYDLHERVARSNSDLLKRICTTSTADGGGTKEIKISIHLHSSDETSMVLQALDAVIMFFYIGEYDIPDISQETSLEFLSLLFRYTRLFEDELLSANVVHDLKKRNVPSGFLNTLENMLQNIDNLRSVQPGGL